MVSEGRNERRQGQFLFVVWEKCAKRYNSGKGCFETLVLVWGLNGIMPDSAGGGTLYVSDEEVQSYCPLNYSLPEGISKRGASNQKCRV